MEGREFVTLSEDATDNGGNPAFRGVKVELLLRCTELANLDTFSKTDPMCVVFVKKFGQWKELARTEAVDESLNPRFTETVTLDYDTDLRQHLLFSVYDIDCKSSDLRKHDFVGSVETTLLQLMKQGTSLSTTSLSLWAPGADKARGLLHVTCEVLNPCRGLVSLHFGAGKLSKKGMFSTNKPDTICEVSRSINSVDFHPVYRSEVVYKSQNPRWRPFELSLQKICNGDPKRQIEFSLWRIKESKEVKKVGSIVTTIQDLTKKEQNGGRGLPFQMVATNAKNSKKGVGEMKMLHYKLDMAYTLLDYVRGGCDLRLMVAIDFTSSNGEISDPKSLHYLGNDPTNTATDGMPTTLRGTNGYSWVPDNQYIEAIKSVGSLLGQYDTDNKILAYGFGAKTKSKRQVSECFPLKLKSENAEVKGVKGLIEAYKKVARKLTFGGPSLLAPVIEEAARVVSQNSPSQERQFYHVLLIITDGVLNDLDQTLAAIQKASHLPLSVVLVGVGPADFEMMDVFQSGRARPAKQASVKAPQRETTCFAALRKYNYTTGANTAIARDALARVSSQVVAYMKDQNITPNRPVAQRQAEVPTKQWVSQRMAFGGGEGVDYVDLGQDTFTATLPRAISGQVGPMCPTCGSGIQPGHDAVFEISL